MAAILRPASAGQIVVKGATWPPSRLQPANPSHNRLLRVSQARYQHSHPISIWRAGAGVYAPAGAAGAQRLTLSMAQVKGERKRTCGRARHMPGRGEGCSHTVHGVGTPQPHPARLQVSKGAGPDLGLDLHCFVQRRVREPNVAAVFVASCASTSACQRQRCFPLPLALAASALPRSCHRRAGVAAELLSGRRGWPSRAASAASRHGRDVFGCWIARMCGGGRGRR